MTDANMGLYTEGVNIGNAETEKYDIEMLYGYF